MGLLALTVFVIGWSLCGFCVVRWQGLQRARLAPLEPTVTPLVRVVGTAMSVFGFRMYYVCAHAPALKLFTHGADAYSPHHAMLTDLCYSGGYETATWGRGYSRSRQLRVNREG